MTDQGSQSADVKLQQVRQAAKTLFLQRGFASVSTAELARAAGVSKETLYSRFPNKEAVLADVLEYLISTVDQDTGEAPPRIRTEAELESGLRSLARTLIHQLTQREYVELARIVITETPRLPRTGEIFSNAVPARALGAVRSLLADARRNGLVRDLDDEVAARMFVGPLVIHVLMNVLLVAPGEPESPLPEIDPLVDLFLVTISPDRPAPS